MSGLIRFTSINVFNNSILRFKISLEVLPHISGNVLPISYQYELVKAFSNLIASDSSSLEVWLKANNLSPADYHKVYSISNLYVPKIHVVQDRLYINVPRIQFWVSFLPEIGTRQLLVDNLLNKQISIGDNVSSVSFLVSAIDDVSPAQFSDYVQFQSLSPVVVKGIRSNGTLEFLSPDNIYFAQFLVDGLIERWENYYHTPFLDSREFCFNLLAPERRKAVTINTESSRHQKIVGYMMKFSLAMSPVLQEFAYVAGVGDEVQNGFGYVELLKKKK